jgi:glycosyltransferase involved in cell wall biosynthesis
VLSFPTVSVIIPTYNRKSFILETLYSLTEQTYPSDRFEVIIIDDGSSDGTKELEAETFPFTLRYFWQTNQGDALARNVGAQQSRADILAFLDDDILVESEYLSHIVCELETDHNRIVVGTANHWPAEATPLSQAVSTPLASVNSHTTVGVAFTDIYSNSMSLRREDYFKVGMMHSLGFSGSSMWCDVDFAYRAYRLGYQFCRCTRAMYWHRDHAVCSLDRYTRRIRTAAYRAVVLFQKYPELTQHVPMFFDKTPISWKQDTPNLIARKIARYLSSTDAAIWSMEQVVNALEKNYPGSLLLPRLYRYIIGGYIYQGYREGLRDFGQVKPQE